MLYSVETKFVSLVFVCCQTIVGMFCACCMLSPYTIVFVREPGLLAQKKVELFDVSSTHHLSTTTPTTC